VGPRRLDAFASRAYFGHRETAEALLDAGADVSQSHARRSKLAINAGRWPDLGRWPLNHPVPSPAVARSMAAAPRAAILRCTRPGFNEDLAVVRVPWTCGPIDRCGRATGRRPLEIAGTRGQQPRRAPADRVDDSEAGTDARPQPDAFRRELSRTPAARPMSYWDDLTRSVTEPGHHVMFLVL